MAKKTGKSLKQKVPWRASVSLEALDGEHKGKWKFTVNQLMASSANSEGEVVTFIHTFDHFPHVPEFIGHLNSMLKGISEYCINHYYFSGEGK